LTAVDATRHVQPFVKSGADGRFGTAVDEVDAGNALDGVADENAFSAFDTFVGIPDNRFAGRINRMMVSLSDESSSANAKCFGKFPKLAVSIAFAEEAIVGMIGKEQFDNGSSGIDHAVGLGFDFHTGGNRKDATWYETSLSFDFDDAHSAGTGGGESFIVTEGWHDNSGAAESVKEHFALSGIDLTTIDFDLDGIRHVFEQKEG
jgi:hypothetical protein